MPLLAGALGGGGGGALLAAVFAGRDSDEAGNCLLDLGE